MSGAGRYRACTRNVHADVRLGLANVRDQLSALGDERSIRGATGLDQGVDHPDARLALSDYFTAAIDDFLESLHLPHLASGKLRRLVIELCFTLSPDRGPFRLDLLRPHQCVRPDIVRPLVVASARDRRQTP